MMKSFLMILLMAFVGQSVSAQSPRRLAEQRKAQKTQADNMTVRAQISFPTSQRMSEDVVWRRDLYREIDLKKEANSPLYYPVEPLGSQMNLFTYIFKLFMLGQIKVYEYRLDGNEMFDDASRVKPMAFLDNYSIFYQKTDRGTHIDNSDIPSREVMGYYLKESAYYDQATATFHRKVLALCPIMTRNDDFGDGGTKYPLFWVKYEDLAPFLAKQTIMTSNLNNASSMSIDDFFTLNRYEGKIYKTSNLLGQSLAQICHNDSSAVNAAQKKIEQELKDFEKNIWGDQAKKDSLDSLAYNKANQKVKEKKTRKLNRRAQSEKAPKVSKPRRGTHSKSTGASSSARVTVRRQRH